MERARTVAVYAAGHFLVDFACAFVMMRYARPAAGWLTAVLLYDFFAFAGQMPLGLLADRFGSGRLFAAGGCLLTAAAFLFSRMPLTLAVIAGVGNALYHIGGGYDTLHLGGDRAGLLGVFVSPGALGLFLGALLGSAGTVPAALPPVLLAFAALAVPGLCGPTEGTGAALRLTAPEAGRLALLFLVVFLRSFTGFLFSFSWKSGLWVWLFVLGTVLGKAAGGFLYDRQGGRITAAVSLLSAGALFLLSGHPVWGAAAVLLFNMTMPVTLRLAADLLPSARGFSFGLLTFALFLGFLPAWLGMPAAAGGWRYTLLCLASLGLLLPVVGGRRS